MKSLSPFLPDPATLSAMLSRVGIDHDTPPPRKASAPAQAITALPPIRFPAVPVEAPTALPIGPSAAPSITPSIAPPAANPLGSDEDALREMFGREGGSLQQRIEAFVTWLSRGACAAAAFVADADGLILANRNAAEAYAEAVASVLHNEEAAFRSTPLPTERSTLIELSDNRFLQVIRVDTGAGRLVVGVVGQEPLSRATCAQVRRVLRKGVDTESAR